jgi:hypothetical protein
MESKPSKRGGKRPGAGPKKQLSDAIRFAIGDAYELMSKARSPAKVQLEHYGDNTATITRHRGWSRQIKKELASRYGTTERMVETCRAEKRRREKAGETWDSEHNAWIKPPR